MVLFILNWLIRSFINGVLFFLLFVFLLYWFYLKEVPKKSAPFHEQFDDPKLNNSIKEMIKKNKEELSNDTESVVALNIVLQFLFQELKDTKSIRRYIIRKVSTEFRELLTTKGAGKIVERLTARDFSLGTSLPVFHAIKLISLNIDSSEKTIQELSILVDIEYTNGFSISIDADLILGKSAYVHVKIASLKGKARIQFTRHPFTHWSFSFVEDPVIQFDAGSQFEGMQIPKLTELIVNQLRKSLKRKHTLPNYKCRFKPFFEPIYEQSLYKAHIDDMLLKNANRLEKELNSGAGDSSTTAGMTHTSDSRSSLLGDNKRTDAVNSGSANNLKDLQSTAKASKLTSDLSLKLNIDKAANKAFRYRQLCQQLGFDLTTAGKLVVCLKTCDRLPEALYSLNMQQAQNQSQPNGGGAGGLLIPASQPGQMPRSISSQQISTQASSIQPESGGASSVIYMTVSIDAVSMKNLMKKQICKEYWPLIEFEINRPNVQQPLGINFMEVFFVNKVEVTVQQIAPGSLASQVPNLRVFDIVHSLNTTRITSLKQLSKIVQKAGVTPLRFVVQRPCIVMNNPILTSAPALTPVATQPPSNRSSMIVQDESVVSQPTQTSQISTSSSDTISLCSIDEQSASNVVNPNTSGGSSAGQSNFAQNLTSSSLVTNTRLRFERLEKKIKSSLGVQQVSVQQTAAQTPTQDVNVSYSAANSAANGVLITPGGQPNEGSASSSTDSKSQVMFTTSTSSLPSTSATENSTGTSYTESMITAAVSSITQPPPKQAPVINTAPVITHTASASNLVDFFCSVAETKAGEEIKILDLIGLLMNANTANGESQTREQSMTDSTTDKSSTAASSSPVNRRNVYFRKTREIKLDKENLLYSFNNKPIQVDESFTFDLNPNTNYLNMFLWTVQHINKSARKKNLLLGYISLPLSEVNVDCWNTSKGETQSTIHFNPIDEFKATAAISRLARSHVISDHPGFNANLSMGAIVLNIQHKLPLADTNDTTNEGKSEASSGAKTQDALPESTSNNDTNATALGELSRQSLANKVAEEIVTMKKNEQELEIKQAQGIANNNEDDGTTHKFIQVQFNENVICQTCNKKIWFKNAFQCAYCGIVIHIKCYERTIDKSVCNRFDSKLKQPAPDSISLSSNKTNNNNNSADTDESFHEIHTSEVDGAMELPVKQVTAKVSFTPTTATTSSSSINSSSSNSSSKGLVSNFFNTIRQRRVNNANSNGQDSGSIASGSSSTSYFKSKYLPEGLSKSVTKTIRKYGKDKSNRASVEPTTPSTTGRDFKPDNSKKSTSTVDVFDKNTSDDNASLDLDEFKDFDPNEEKLYGTELFNELPYEERKLKYEENIIKYRSSIDMMTKMKDDLSKEIETMNRLKNSNQSAAYVQQEEQVKSQVKHISDQIKCVGFLLMQAQIGLESLTDDKISVKSNESSAPPASSISTIDPTALFPIDEAKETIFPELASSSLSSSSSIPTESTNILSTTFKAEPQLDADPETPYESQTSSNSSSENEINNNLISQDLNDNDDANLPQPTFTEQPILN